MSSKIKLEYPYNQDWKWGYLTEKTTGRDKGRKNISLVNSRNNRSSVSYARYLMSVHLGRYLTDDEHVDHINEDKADDRMDNYQILTNAENTKKSQAFAIYVDLKCPQCESRFLRRRKHTHLCVKKKFVDFCSRSCSSKYYSRKDKIKFTEENSNAISEVILHVNEVEDYVFD